MRFLLPLSKVARNGQYTEYSPSRTILPSVVNPRLKQFCGGTKNKTMKILILNGANLNLQGKRDKGVYGCESFDTFIPRLQALYSDIEIDYRQTNIEGEIVDYLHRAEGNYDGVLLNAGGYTHTSVVIRDAIAAIETPVVEIHISNIAAREEFRHTTLIGSVAIGSIVGFGLNSYRIGVEALKLHLQ
jgi:3-dehydroquinate dehydratase-2